MTINMYCLFTESLRFFILSSEFMKTFFKGKLLFDFSSVIKDCYK